jgi:membrane protein required for colicin V production
VELFTLLAVFAGLYAAVHFSDFISVKLKEDAGWDWEYVPIVAYALCFLAVGAMVYFGGKMLEKVIKVVQLGLVNRMAGALFSIITMTLLLGGIILMSDSYDQRSDILSEETKEGSLLYYPVLNTSKVLMPKIEESSLYVKERFLERKLKEVLQ